MHVKLDALSSYLHPNKAKLESKGVESVRARVMNLQEVNPAIEHEGFCDAIEEAFIKKWGATTVNRRTLKVEDLEKIPELMKIYKESSEWSWRFGQTPEFSNSLEKKFSWALVDVQFDVEGGYIVRG